MPLYDKEISLAGFTQLLGHQMLAIDAQVATYSRVIIFGQRRRYDSLEWILSRVRGTRRPGNYRGSMERILPPARGVSSIGSTVGDASSTSAAGGGGPLP